MDADVIKVDIIEPGILHLSLNRSSQLNVLNKEMLAQLSQALQKAKEDSSIKAILLTGEGKAFCAGADINQLQTLNGRNGLEFAKQGQAIFNQLEHLGKPSLAAIQGVALGGGCELAMAATLRIATPDAFFGQPEIKLGIIPGFGGTQRLTRLIGAGRALEMCLTGRRITASLAEQWGLVNEVVASELLLFRAKEILQTLTQLSGVAIASLLTVINRGRDLSMDDALALEAAYFGLCCTTQDKQEGVRAFLEKRTAVFSGE